MRGRSLEGARVVVARAAGRGASLCDRIVAAGGEALCLPVIDIRPLDDVQLPGVRPDWLVFTSVAAVDHGVPLLDEALQNSRVAAIGNATADALRAAGVAPDLVPSRQETEGLLALPEFEAVDKTTVWIVKGRGGRTLLAHTLIERGAHVERLDVYERRMPAAGVAPLLERWCAGRVDAIVVSSRASLENLHALLNAEGRRRLGETQLVVPTERMLKLALDFDIRPAPVVAADASDDALFAALASWWRGRRQDPPMTNETHAEDRNGKQPTAATGAPAGGANKPGKRQPTRPRGSALRTLARLVLLLIVIAALAAASWYGWHWLRAGKARYDDTITRQAEAISRLEARLAQLEETRVTQDEFEALQDGMSASQTELRDRMNAIANDMNALRDAAQGGRRDLIRAEVEYLLRVAADALYLTRDVDTAIYALQAADDRLRQLAEPRLMPVRQLIADHLQALGAVSLPDTSGMALKVGSLMREVSELPLRQAQHVRRGGGADGAADADAGWWQRLRAGVARLFDKLVDVRRAEPPPPLLTPEEHFFLYRNVELQLAAARTALLAGDIAAYRQSLEIAREWLNRYFDVQDPAVANAIDDLSGLLDVPLQPALPDISPALERFRALTGNRLRSVPSSAGADTE